MAKRESNKPQLRVLTEDQLVRGYGQIGSSGHDQRERYEAARRAIEAIKERAHADERAKRPDREQVIEKLTEALGEHAALFCTRDWSAWSYNTMTAEDFMDASGDAEMIGEIADAAFGPFADKPEEWQEPVPEEWQELVNAERARQVAIGYDEKHDSEHGIGHLLRWADDYLRRGELIKGAALVKAARTLDEIEARRAQKAPEVREVTEAEVHVLYIDGETYGYATFGGSNGAGVLALQMTRQQWHDLGNPKEVAVSVTKREAAREVSRGNTQA